MRDYELMVAVSPAGSDEGFPRVLEQVGQAVVNHGGIVAHTMTNPPWGHRRLAYPIRDFRDAYYAVLHVTLDPTKVVLLERDLRLMEPVLRHIAVRRDDALKAEAKAEARRAANPNQDEGESEGEGESVVVEEEGDGEESE